MMTFDIVTISVMTFDIVTIYMDGISERPKVLTSYDCCVWSIIDSLLNIFHDLAVSVRKW